MPASQEKPTFPIYTSPEHRQGSKISLTDAGELLLKHSEKILDDYKQLEYEMHFILFTSAESATIDSKSKNKSSLVTIPSEGTLANER